jgi:hypothetical protein
MKKAGLRKSMVSALIVSRTASTAAYEASRQPSNSVTALTREAIWRCQHFVLKQARHPEALIVPPVLQLGTPEVQLVA